MPIPIESYQKDQLQVAVYKNENKAGEAAADMVAEELSVTIKKRGDANLILATGTSQFAFLDALKNKDLDWKKIRVFHLDEYKGLSEEHPASFRKYLKERILDEVQPGEVHLIKSDIVNLNAEMKAYESLLKQHPVDVACIGIGENGHIAFNDPPVADFDDPLWVKLVKLDEDCRKQQLNEGWFPTLGSVPKEAVTLTVSAIMNCKKISCVVPGKRKAEAVWKTLYGNISTNCPASVLRRHSNAMLFLDTSSAPIKEN